MQSRKQRRVDKVAVIWSVRALATYTLKLTGRNQAGDRTLICTGQDVSTKRRGLSTLLLVAVVATILAGCVGTGSGDSSQQTSRGADSTKQEADGAGSSGQASGNRLGHPALGSPDAPVVLTEYSDYQ